MENYNVGFIAVASQKVILSRLGNKDIDSYLKKSFEEGKDNTALLKYFIENLGYNKCGVIRLLRYIVYSPLPKAALQALASVYAGHFAIFAEKEIPGEAPKRTVAGFNPASLLCSMWQEGDLKKGGSISGKWYDDGGMFEDTSKRVISISVSKAVYEIFLHEIECLQNNKSHLFSKSGVGGEMLYGWYGLDKSINKFNCVTAGIEAVSIILENKIKPNLSKHAGVEILSGVVIRMNKVANDLVDGNAGTLTWIYLSMQETGFLIDDNVILESIVDSAMKRKTNSIRGETMHAKPKL
ncbi:hypothetical protein [Azospirillum brasilense]|uniref:hypothetical protein n=1 Tax=Azospirillum brasilense TaxID=192 RepID=UPI0010C05DB5|nr:hypothetical protein [Azospirillum brasilense]